jgi:hypothetical protein
MLQIADVLAKCHPLAVRELLEVIMNAIIYSNVQHSHPSSAFTV